MLFDIELHLLLSGVNPVELINDWFNEMNGPRRTACFAKGMHSNTLFTLK